MKFSRTYFYSFKRIDKVDYYECPSCFCEILKEEIDTSEMEFNMLYTFECPECGEEIEVVYCEINGEEGVKFTF